DDNILHENVQIGDTFYIKTDKSDNIYFEVIGDNKSGYNKDGSVNASNVVTFDARLTAPQDSTISDEMTSDTIWAVVIAIICMLVYIRIRFSDIRFGISSVAALLHDVLIVIAFYAAARVSVGNTFIACLLTIVGYSINATIVVFDRVRENMAEMTRKDTLKDVVNKSIAQTLSRSIFTSFTTLVMVVALYILGVTSIRDFALPLIVGIVCGAYSSVCLAGALWYVLREKFPPKEISE
ncbi:MAG: protein translocase subunit SecF, partial [Lachnospiraceae bacterium]|nr:protein translocase subunit SecF [Lachnospiraceae bacterium]